MAIELVKPDETAQPLTGTYFRAQLGVARHLTASFDGPELLVAYVVLCYSRFRARDDKEFKVESHTTAGAQLMWRTTGLSKSRCKDAVRELHKISIGGTPLLVDTGIKAGFGKVYRIMDVGGDHAYMPSLLLNKANPDTVLRQLCSPRLAHSTVRRDALMALLTLYHVVDYKGSIGAPADRFPWQQWISKGFAEATLGVGRGHHGDFELGRVDRGQLADMWLVSAPHEDAWQCPPAVAKEMFPGSEDAGQRLAEAVGLLSQVGAITRVAVGRLGNNPYPLWYYSAGVRETLWSNFGLRTDLARDFHNMACASGADADNMLMRAAVEERTGTGLFYCLATPNAQDPGVRTLAIPRMYANTPLNRDGFAYTAENTTNIEHLITTGRQAFRQSMRAA